MASYRRLRRVLLALLAGVSGIAACDGDRSGFPWGEPIASPTGSSALVIGFVGTLSGPDSWRGEDAFEGADLGVQALNRSRPEGTPPFELRPLDDGGKVALATRLVEQVTELDDLVGIVYAGPPEGLPPAEDALARARVPAILFYGDLLCADFLRPHLFQVSPTSASEARTIASYLRDDRRYRNVGALAERSVTGDAALAALETALAGSDVRLASSRYAPTGSLAAPLERLRRRRVESIVIQGSPAAFTEAVRRLRESGAGYTTTAAARIASAPRPLRRRRRRLGVWRPQPVGFDLAISPRVAGVPHGTVAADSYGRGAHYLPIGSMRRFRRAFRAWWDSSPTGWEARSFDAARMIGWAARRARPGEDLAAVLEGLSGERFSALPVGLSPRDHLSVEPSTVGLWVVPHPGARVVERARSEEFASFPWVPLARSFAARRRITHVLPDDRRVLFAPPRGRYAPAFALLRFGVTTPRSDPVH